MTIHSILIANRGEIACRIIATARQLGYKTIAVYAEPDRESLHVQQADMALCIGAAASEASYLNIPHIIAAAKQSQATAIHPGYGFLSENVDFARACATAGIIFIGPGIEALEIMGSKQRAKQYVREIGVPLTPGYDGLEQSDTRLLAEARLIGFPVLIKAALGGGGRGMRRVESEDNFLTILDSARREARASFGDDTVILEKLVIDARHIEIQIMADHHGHVVHFFERDCSLQRRHQKIIEEAPAAILNPALRERIAGAACAVAQHIGYRGAGTVEFLLAPSGDFYFMEMNTRLQVEHPVTEMITHHDLVALQIRIACGEPLPFVQNDVLQKGHAIECRIYAEDPAHGFLPSTGTIQHFQIPTGEGIRVDTGYQSGSVISVYYDAMIAKLITWGDTRAIAIRRMQYALEKTIITGVKTNLPFLQRICHHPEFIQNTITTDFLDHKPIKLPSADPIMALLGVAASEYMHIRLEQDDPLLAAAFAWQLHLMPSWYAYYRIAQKTYCLRFMLRADTALEVTVSTCPDENPHARYVLEHIRKTDEGALCFMLDGENRSIWMTHHADEYVCCLPEENLSVSRVIWDREHPGHTTGEQQLRAPMPATVIAILKKIGDTVQQGEPLIILEAMKMEHTLSAPHAGTIDTLFCSVSGQVSEGQELVSVRAHELVKEAE